MQRENDYPPECPECVGHELAGAIVEMTKKAKAKSDRKTGDQKEL